MTKDKQRARHWADIGEAGSRWGIRFLFFCYRVGGKTLYKLFLLPVICYFYLFRHTNRRASLEYLTRIQRRLPSLRGRNRYLLSAQHFWQFALCLIDKIAVWMGKIGWEQTTSHRGEIITELCDRQQGAILLISHLGNFEVCRVFSARRDNFRLTVLLHTKHAKNFNHLLEEHQGQQIQVMEVTEITPATAMVLSERIEQGEFIAIAADRVAIDNPESNLKVDFLDEPASFPKGPFTLAALLKAPLVAVFCLREAGHYHIYFDWLSRSVDCKRRERPAVIQRLVEDYAGHLEHYCLQAPLQWFNFYNFWARSPGDGENVDD